MVHLPRRKKKDEGRPSRRKGSFWSALAPAVSMGRGSIRARLGSGNKHSIHGSSGPNEDLDEAFGGENNYEAYGGKSGRGLHALECSSPLFGVESLCSSDSSASLPSASPMDTRANSQGDVVKHVMQPASNSQQSENVSSSHPQELTSMSTTSSVCVQEAIERKSSNSNEVGSSIETGGSTSTTLSTMPSINNSDMVAAVSDSGLSRSERYELIHFLRSRDTKLKDEAALLAKVDKLASYPRKQLVMALSRLYGSVPEGLSKMRYTLPRVEEELEGSRSWAGSLSIDSLLY